MSTSGVDDAGVERLGEAGKRRFSPWSLFAPLADLLLPPVCIACRTRVGGHGLICGACFAKIEFIAPPLCDRLGVPLPYDAGEGSSSRRRRSPSPQSTTGRVPWRAIPRPCAS